MKKGIDIVKLAISIVVCQVTGFIGSVFTLPSIPTWYTTLKKPSFTPPNWLFGPIWTTLYVLMGISVFLIWSRELKDSQVKKSLSIFFIQLIVNVLWSIAFFGFRSPSTGFIIIIILWVSILFTIIKFYRISKTAGFLLIPYIIWVSLAAILNLTIFILNH